MPRVLSSPSPNTRSSLFHTPVFRLASCILFLLITHSAAFAEHVHQLYYNNSQWVDQDLTTLTGGGIASDFGAIVAFTTPGPQFHVYYVDSTFQHVHQLYYNGSSWSDSDLTAIVNGPTADVYGLAGFAIGNFQYVFYVDTSNHVHELDYVNNWADQDLTATVGGNLASAAPMVAFPTKPNNQFHVYYQDVSSLHEYQLYFNGSTWSYQDLTSLTGAYCYTQWATGVAVGNMQHVVCPGYAGSSDNLDLLDINYNNSVWSYQDITFLAQSSPINLSSGLAVFPVLSQGEVYGVTDDTHIHQYTYKRAQWTGIDLTASVGAPSDPYFGAMVAFPTKPNNQFHIYYQPTNDVYQLFYNGSAWAINNLTNSGQVSYDSGMAGFAIGNLQHVFYLSTGN